MEICLVSKRMFIPDGTPVLVTEHCILKRRNEQTLNIAVYSATSVESCLCLKAPREFLAIHKLTQNILLSRGDYTELEHIFTCELGSKEDYAREFRDTPFGLLVRKVAKLDHDAAMQAFSKFINDESLNAKQIAFVQKVIHYIEQNGYVESKAVLMKPPFDQPILLTCLFDGKTGSELMETINSVKENATHVTA